MQSIISLIKLHESGELVGVNWVIPDPDKEKEIVDALTKILGQPENSAMVKAEDVNTSGVIIT